MSFSHTDVFIAAVITSLQNIMHELLNMKAKQLQ